ncbi:MAG: ribonuclease III [Eubacterium sp.]|nr:ribonuclease III [Eubacterium sp.]
MEKGINEYILDAFDIKPDDIRTYSPLTLAYIGDGIFDLVIRSKVVAEGNTSPSKLHRKTMQFVKAEAQSKMVEALLDDLTEEEKDVFKRGRNAKSYTSAKNAKTSEYRKATGFEALLGYLYLKDDFERIVDLTVKGLDRIKDDPALLAHKNGNHR